MRKIRDILEIWQAANPDKSSERIELEKRLELAPQYLSKRSVSEQLFQELLLKLPESFTGKAIIQSRSESVHLSDLKFPGNLGVSSDAGEILLENVETTKIDIRGNLCKVNCYGVGVTETMDISSKTGQIQCYVDGTEEEYSVFCNTERKRHVAVTADYSDTCRPRGIRANIPEQLGHGPRKVCITTETGQIDFAFQNGVKTRKTAGRYRRKNSFPDW